MTDHRSIGGNQGENPWGLGPHGDLDPQGRHPDGIRWDLVAMGMGATGLLVASVLMSWGWRGERSFLGYLDEEPVMWLPFGLVAAGVLLVAASVGIDPRSTARLARTAAAWCGFAGGLAAFAATPVLLVVTVLTEGAPGGFAAAGAGLVAFVGAPFCVPRSMDRRFVVGLLVVVGVWLVGGCMWLGHAMQGFPT